MSLSNYSELQTSILLHLGRPGDTIIPVADLITIAEAEFNRVLRTQAQAAFSDITTVGDTQDYPLPTDLNVLWEVRLISTSHKPVLESMPLSYFDGQFSEETGQPLNYTIIGQRIYFGPIPDGEYTIRLRYYAKVPALSSANPTNWLLTAHPDAYLWQALRHAQVFLGADNADLLPIYEQRAGIAIAEIRQLDIRNKAGGAPVRMRTSLRARDSVFPR